MLGELTMQLVSSFAVALACSLALGSCAVPPPGDPPGANREVGGARGPLFADPPRTLLFVAHQDDDLGLMSPNLANTIARGGALTTVYLTSGDADFGCLDYVQGREAGVRRAYAQMAGVPDAWIERIDTHHGKRARVVRLQETEIELVFLGLPNGANTDLERLWDSPGETIATLSYDARRPGVDTYTRAELIETLHQILIAYAPDHVNTLDSSRLQPPSWPFDHSDHVASALFALAALQRYEGAPSLRTFRGYNVNFEPENVSAPEAAAKLAVFQTYYAHDAKVCRTGVTSICGRLTLCDHPNIAYAGYEHRQYSIELVQDVTGAVRGPGGGCLHGNGGAVMLASCADGDPAQRWELSPDGRVRHAATSTCLSAEGTPRGAALALRACTGGAEQWFALTTQGQLRGPDAGCVEANRSALHLAECANVAGQLGFTAAASPGVFTAAMAGFGDGDVPDDVSRYGSLDLADVDGDGHADACVRKADGIHCAPFVPASGSFASPVLRLSRFRDDEGWNGAGYGSTVQLADIDGDGHADVCGRGAQGVYCATWSPGSAAFTGFAKRTSGADFGDLAGYRLRASYYGSLRVVDVNGDGVADVCGRNARGIECALNRGDGYFEPVSQWIANDFSDALGWADPRYGSTLRYAGVDGDGLTDVCGRGLRGLHCALGNGQRGFVLPHAWSAAGDFADASGWGTRASHYGSIRLADLNGDGRADACGRSSAGLVCALSMGASFATAQPVLVQHGFADGDGFGEDRYGTTLAFAELNGDGHADVCARGPIPGGGVGLRCAYAF